MGDIPAGFCRRDTRNWCWYVVDWPTSSCPSELPAPPVIPLALPPSPSIPSFPFRAPSQAHISNSPPSSPASSSSHRGPSLVLSPPHLTSHRTTRARLCGLLLLPENRHHGPHLCLHPPHARADLEGAEIKTSLPLRSAFKKHNNQQWRRRLYPQTVFFAPELEQVDITAQLN